MSCGALRPEPSGHVTDAELVAAALDGDKEAFGRLADRHRPMALALARRMLPTPEAAADAVGEATVAALVGLDRLRSPERFGSWYAGIALNFARHVLRERSGLVPAGETATPEEEAEAADLAARVRRAVASLAPGQRDAVLAFYWQGLTHSEAAAELGISRNAVKARLHDARAALAPKLAAAVPIPETRRSRKVSEMPTVTRPTWVEMTVAEVRCDQGDDPTRRAHTVVLEERGGVRRLPIWIGLPEATMLACSLESVEFPRPMTYVLAANLLRASGSELAEVRVTRLAESTFYAVVVIDGPAGRAEVDARPSDTLNLALVCGVPIRVDSAVLDDPAAAGRLEWQEYGTNAAGLVAEVQQRQEELQALLAVESESDRTD